MGNSAHSHLGELGWSVYMEFFHPALLRSRHFQPRSRQGGMEKFHVNMHHYFSKNFRTAKILAKLAGPLNWAGSPQINRHFNLLSSIWASCVTNRTLSQTHHFESTVSIYSKSIECQLSTEYSNFMTYTCKQHSLIFYINTVYMSVI